MKLGEAIPKYQTYRNQLQDKKKDIYKQLKDARIRQNVQEVMNGLRKRHSSSFRMTRHQLTLISMRMRLMD